MSKLLAAVGVVCLSMTAMGQKVYVDDSATGSDDGTSWANAYNDLQDALTAANSTDVIMVAEGTYKPSKEVNVGVPRSVAFDLGATRLLSGGHKGGATGTDVAWVPDGSTNATILSGDIGTAGVDTDNAYHVVAVRSSSRVEGFKIEGGYADGLASNNADKGAGMAVVSGGTATLSRLNIRDNTATLGAGIWVRDGVIYLQKSRIRDNNAALGNGAGIHMETSDGSRIYNTIFHDNTCTGSGSIDAFGGAIYAGDEVEDLVVTNCLFQDNEADKGGAVYVADHGDGGSSGWLNNTIAYNDANDSNGGGGMYVADQDSGSSVLIGNSILYKNLARTLLNNLYDASTELTVEYSDVYTGTGAWTGTGNIDVDPKFKNGPARDLRLQIFSGCNDAGNDNLMAADFFDFDGDADPTEFVSRDVTGINEREMDTCQSSHSGVNDTGGDADIVDMGAYEQESDCPDEG